MFRRLAATMAVETRTRPQTLLLRRSSGWFSWLKSPPQDTGNETMEKIVSSQQQLVSMQRELVSSQYELVRKFDAQLEPPRRDMAILIDAENNSHHSISAIIKEASRFGCATCRRIYGDWTRPQSQHWKASLLEFAIVPIQQFSNSVGKNSSDSSMIIDAMDMLHSDKYDVFVIVSSDADFTRLATRIRENGKIVIGMGRAQTPPAFASACDKFVTIKKVIAPSPSASPADAPETNTFTSLPQPIKTATFTSQNTPSEQPALTKPTADAAADDDGGEAAANGVGNNDNNDNNTMREVGNDNSNNRPKDSAKKKNGIDEKRESLIEAFSGSISKHADDAGWASLSDVGSELRGMTPKFDPRVVCGSSSLSKFVKFLPKTFEYKMKGKSDAFVRVKRI